MRRFHRGVEGRRRGKPWSRLVDVSVSRLVDVGRLVDGSAGVVALTSLITGHPLTSSFVLAQGYAKDVPAEICSISVSPPPVCAV